MLRPSVPTDACRPRDVPICPPLACHVLSVVCVRRCVSVCCAALTEENEDVIEKYLSEDPRCLILPVLTVHEVFDHPGAVRLAKKVDPDGRRIIGVVTKIDQVRAHAHPQSTQGRAIGPSGVRPAGV